jgi:HAD superfamily hydrolase (TIGR01450 family)
VRKPDRLYRGYAFDLDGTVYLGAGLLPGAGEVLSLLKNPARVVYVTNKPLESPADYASKLSRLGIRTEARDVVCSTDSLLLYLAAHRPASRLFVIGESSLINLLKSAGYLVVDEAANVDSVVVSFDRTFHYSKLQIAFDAVRAGARIIATNPDPYCPTPEGGLPDCAAMLAALESCTGTKAEAVVGKPSSHMAAALLDRLGIPANEVLLVGDRLSTDIRMANEAGMASALVLTGATMLADVDASEQQPNFILDSLWDILPETIMAACSSPMAEHKEN